MRVPSASLERPVRGEVRVRKPRSTPPRAQRGTEPSRSTISRDKRLERERRVRQRRVQALLRVGLLAAAVAAVLAVGTWLYRSPLLSVDTVEATGVRHLSADRVRELAAVPSDATLVRLPSSAIEKRVRSDPWVESVRLRRRWPHTLLIEVTERTPAAVLDTGGATLWMIDAHAFVLGERSAEESSPLVVVRDVPDVKVSPGAALRSEPLLNALKVLSGLSPQLKEQVRAISAPSVDKTALYTRDDVEVFVGSAEGIAQKDLVTRRILEEQRGKVVYINVRTVDRPTWRGLETDK